MENRPKVIVIGLDGATWDLIKPWAEDGKLPTFEYLMENGAWGVLESTIPPYSPIAWNSIYTGVYPIKHGIFGSFKREKDSYHFRPVLSKDRKVEAIWNILSLFERRSILINLPFTYPPEKINGIMITGLGTPDRSSNFTYPPDFRDILIKKFPNYDVDFNEEKLSYEKDISWLLQKVRDVTSAQIELTKFLMRNENWNLLFSVFRAPDVIQHYFWSNREIILEVYNYIDDFLRYLLDAIDENTTLILCSDHGFSEVKKTVYINNWLEQEGFLKIKTKKTQKFIDILGINAINLKSFITKLGLWSFVKKFRDTELFKKVLEIIPNPEYGELFNVDWNKTKAYFFYGSDGTIYINLKGREPLGIVNGDEYDKIINDLKAALLNLRDPETGDRVIEKVLTRKELINNDFNILDDIPDVFLLKNKHYKLSGYNPNKTIFGPPVVGRLKRPADHDINGIFLAYGSSIKHTKVNASVVNIMPTILAILNLPISMHVDGKPLLSIFRNSQAEIKYIDIHKFRLKKIIHRINLKRGQEK